MTSLHCLKKICQCILVSNYPHCFWWALHCDMVSMERIETCPQMHYSFLLSRMDSMVLAWSLSETHESLAWVCVSMRKPSCLDVAIEVSLALYLLEFPDVRYWNIDQGECSAFTLLWFHLYAHTADAWFTQWYKLQMWRYMRELDQIKLSINAWGEKERKVCLSEGFHTYHLAACTNLLWRVVGAWLYLKQSIVWEVEN